MSKTNSELLDGLAEKWEDDVREYNKIQPRGGIIAPILAEEKLKCIIELRYLLENGEVPEDLEDIDLTEHTELLEKAARPDNFIEEFGGIEEDL